MTVTAANYEQLPANLPVPEDDGAAAHLAGAAMPSIVLPATTGETLDLSQLGPRAIVYVYPMTGTPGVPLIDGWNEIPGARGCTPESMGFRDSFEELAAMGAQVFGLSVQSSAEQGEAAARLGLPFPLLSDFWPHGAVAKLYGVFDEDKGVATRGTFIIDKAGLVRWEVVNPIPQARDIAEYQKVLAELS